MIEVNYWAERLVRNAMTGSHFSSPSFLSSMTNCFHEFFLTYGSKLEQARLNSKRVRKTRRSRDYYAQEPRAQLSVQ